MMVFFIISQSSKARDTLRLRTDCSFLSDTETHDTPTLDLFPGLEIRRQLTVLLMTRRMRGGIVLIFPVLIVLLIIIRFYFC